MRTEMTNKWTAIETMLYTLWRYHTGRTTGVGETSVPEPPQRGADAIKYLRDAHVLSESLSDEASRLRQTRNAWLHRLEPVTGEIAGLSTRVVGQLLGGAWGLPFRSRLVARMLGRRSSAS